MSLKAKKANLKADVKTAKRQKPIELYFLTGFLGSGKTTFLKNILAELASKDLKAGVIVNEFGQTGVDGTVIKEQELEIRELNDGQIFCGCMQGKFIKTIAALADYPLDYLIVESSGLANPTSLNRVLGDLEKLAGGKYNYRGMLCLVDPVNFLALVNTVNAVEEQIIHSDCVLINKLDLAQKDTLMQVQEKIRELNPCAPIYKGSYAKFDSNFLDLKVGSMDSKNETANKIARNVKVPYGRPKHYLIQTNEKIDQDKLRQFLKDIAPNAFRIKGFANCGQGRFHLDVVNDDIQCRPMLNRKNEARLTGKIEEADKFAVTEFAQTEIVVISSIGEKIAPILESKWQKIMDIPVIIKENVFTPPTYDFSKVI